MYLVCDKAPPIILIWKRLVANSKSFVRDIKCQRLYKLGHSSGWELADFSIASSSSCATGVSLAVITSLVDLHDRRNASIMVWAEELGRIYWKI